MRIDRRPYLDIDGPHRRRRRILSGLGWTLALVLMVAAVVASMAQPLPF